MQSIYEDGFDGSNIWIDFRETSGHDDFPAIITTAGDRRIMEGERYHFSHWDMRNFSSEFYILQYSQEGTAKIRYRRPDGSCAEYALPPERCFFITHKDEFEFYTPDNHYWSYIYISFRGELAKRIFEKIAQGEPVRLLRRNSACVAEFQHLFRLALHHNLNACDIRKAACAILLELQNELESAENSGHNAELTREAARWVRNHLQTADVRALAAHFNLSEKYFQDYFRKQCGQTPGKFLMEQRILYAKHLLECTNMKLDGIAELASFTDASHFCRVFRKTYGTTPDSYRKNGENKNRDAPFA